MSIDRLNAAIYELENICNSTGQRINEGAEVTRADLRDLFVGLDQLSQAAVFQSECITGSAEVSLKDNIDQFYISNRVQVAEILEDVRSVLSCIDKQALLRTRLHKYEHARAVLLAVLGNLQSSALPVSTNMSGGDSQVRQVELADRMINRFDGYFVRSLHLPYQNDDEALLTGRVGWQINAALDKLIEFVGALDQAIAEMQAQLEVPAVQQ